MRRGRDRDRNRRTTRTELAGWMAGEALSKPRSCWACLVIAAYWLRPKGGVAALFFARQCPLAVQVTLSGTLLADAWSTHCWASRYHRSCRVTDASHHSHGHETVYNPPAVLGEAEKGRWRLGRPGFDGEGHMSVWVAQFHPAVGKMG